MPGARCRVRATPRARPRRPRARRRSRACRIHRGRTRPARPPAPRAQDRGVSGLWPTRRTRPRSCAPRSPRRSISRAGSGSSRAARGATAVRAAGATGAAPATYQKEINSAKLAQSIKSEKQAVKNGLKTKFDRLMILQNQVDQCLDQLTSRQCDDVYIFDGSAISYKRNMNQREINDTRKTLNTLQIEISKIEGDYAIIKTENTNIEIKPLEFRVLNKDDN